MKPEQFKTFIKTMFAKNQYRSIFVTGAVGVGKSTTIKEACDEEGYEMRDIRLSLLDATDLRGLPSIENKETFWTKPTFLPTENKRCVLFFDEFSNANSSMQNACLQLVLDRRIGEYALPDEVRGICAGNRLQDGAYVYKMSSALSNRFINIEFESDFEDWKKWAYTHNINPIVISFHNYRGGNLLNNYTKEIVGSFATPRTWTYLSELMNVGLDNGVFFEAIKGAVGEAAGIEFYGFYKIYKELPEPEKILNDDKLTVPTNSNILYALCGAILEYTKQNPNVVDKVMKYALRLPVEFSVLLVNDMLKTNLKNKILTLKETEEYATKYRQFFDR